MKTISADIKAGEFKPVYLIYGDEPYLKKQYQERLSDAIAGGDTMNCTYFDKDNVSVKEIISIGDTMPFFADRRLIVVENSGFFKAANDELADYIRNIPDYLVLVFVEEQVDKRNKVYKAVNEAGYAAEMSPQPVAVLTKWVATLLKNEGRAINADAVGCLLDKTGASMNLIRQEIDKLVAYTDGKDVIEKADVEAVCSTQTISKIFDMVSAIGSKNEQLALKLYYDLLTLKEKPMSILFLIVRQFNGIIQVLEGNAAGKSNAVLAKEMGTPPFVVGKYAAQAKNFTREYLVGALKDCAQAEEDVKRGRLSDRVAVEMIIIKYSRA